MTGPSATAAPSITFPDAPPGAVAPESSSALFKAARKASFAKHAGWKWACYVGIALGVLGGVLLAAGAGPVGIVLLVVGGCAIAGLALWLVSLNSSSDDAFWTGWTGARGLTPTSGGLPSNMPLLSEGDKRHFDRVAQGRIAGADAHVAHYTYTVISYRTDSEGRRHKEETNHPFTVACVQLPDAVAARYSRVHLDPNAIKFGFGGLVDKVSSMRGVQTESKAFDDRYDLRVADQQDDIAVFELFSTTFLDQLANLGLPVFWQQAGGDLLFYTRGHLEQSARLDELCETVRLVRDRYAQEWQ